MRASFLGHWKVDQFLTNLLLITYIINKYILFFSCWYNSTRATTIAMLIRYLIFNLDCLGSCSIEMFCFRIFVWPSVFQTFWNEFLAREGFDYVCILLRALKLLCKNCWAMLVVKWFSEPTMKDSNFLQIVKDHLLSFIHTYEPNDSYLHTCTIWASPY